MLVQSPTSVTFVNWRYIDANVTDSLVTHGGMDTSVIELQPENAPEPMLVTLEGIRISVIELQPEKALEPMAVTGYSSIVDGISTSPPVPV